MNTQVFSGSANGRIAAPPEPRVVFTTASEWQEASEHILVMACTDPRFQIARKEFVEGHFGLTRYDSLVLPGGPATILYTSILSAIMRMSVRELNKHHNFTRAIAFAHYDCLIYRLRFPRLTAAERRERQFADLRVFKTEIRRVVPGIQADTFYAEPAGGRIQFLSVE